MAKQQPESDPEQYTKPELRDHIKHEIIAGDKGGRPGQWSARKAQLLAHEYAAQGGGYKHSRTEAQESLKEWGEEKWTTSDGQPAKRGDVTARYLPEKAWEELTPGQTAATNKKKKKASKQGQQFVANTKPAATARKDATRRTATKKGAAGPTKRAAGKGGPSRSRVRQAARG